MKKLIRRYFAIFCALGVLFSSLTTYAATVYSNLLIFPTTGGVSYSGQSSLSTNSPNVNAGVSVMASPSTTSGKMGAKARLYRSNGALVKSSSAKYNSGTSSKLSTSTGNISGSGNYYSKGIAYIWNGTGYNSYDLPLTPTQGISLMPVLKNEYGEIYGSEYFLNLNGIKPDLILAVGTNGEEGYIRAEELDNDPKTIEEALKYTPSNYEIPLYKEDGITIIGSFKVEAPNVIEE